MILKNNRKTSYIFTQKKKERRNAWYFQNNKFLRVPLYCYIMKYKGDLLDITCVRYGGAVAGEVVERVNINYRDYHAVIVNELPKQL